MSNDSLYKLPNGNYVKLSSIDGMFIAECDYSGPLKCFMRCMVDITANKFHEQVKFLDRATAQEFADELSKLVNEVLANN